MVAKDDEASTWCDDGATSEGVVVRTVVDFLKISLELDDSCGKPRRLLKDIYGDKVRGV